MTELGFTNAETAMAGPGHFTRPISRIAENVTVITADDIARINAHTLSDILQNVPGIQLDYLRTPSTFSFFNIQGALSNTVLVLIDGIRQNDFDQNLTTPGQIPVQQIERIEIVKGAASASLGAALGGVINIITKSPDPERGLSGLVSGSIGDRFTADSRAELSGSAAGFGYYLSTGNLHSDGLTPNTDTDQNNIYTKLTYQLPERGRITLGFSHLSAHPGAGEADTVRYGFVHDEARFRRANSFLQISQPLSPELSLELDGYLTSRNDHVKFGGRGPQGTILFSNDFSLRDASRGANLRLSWDSGPRRLATGLEYRHVQGSNRDLLSDAPPFYDLEWESWAWYAEGAYAIGELTLLPGVRFDATGISGDCATYSLGATYQLTEDTTLRAYAAKGFALPYIQVRGTLQRVHTVQAGLESGALPFVWVKGTFFYNTLRHSVSAGQVVAITDQDRQGIELELRTAQFLGLSLNAGYTYLYAEDAETGHQLQSNGQQSVPPHLVKLALKYDNAPRGLRGTLTGNYVFWNAEPGQPMADQGMIWDLHLSWQLKPYSGVIPELFFSAHNLFDGNQTTDTTLYSIPRRWFEGGMRLSF